MQEKIEALYRKERFDQSDRRLLEDFLDELEEGRIRAAQKVDGCWVVHTWVKKGILAAFRMGSLTDFSINEQFRYFDKDTLPLKRLAAEHKVRLVPGGSSVRRGAHLGPGVTCMPPMYVNVGAFVDRDSMIDSHALVGSCAQIGGVLEPVGALPVIVEDDVLVGGNCGVFEGTLVEQGAILGAGVILTRSTPLYDLVHRKIYRASEEGPLRVPSGAVVVPGSRPLRDPWGSQEGLSLYTPIIIKYRDSRSDQASRLEEVLR